MLLEIEDAFEERNMFLIVLLGLLSAAEQVDQLVEAIAAQARADTVRLRRPSRLDDGTEQVLHAVLGALSFFRTVRSHLPGPPLGESPEASPQTNGRAAAAGSPRGRSRGDANGRRPNRSGDARLSRILV